jgi:hypothetical protein
VSIDSLHRSLEIGFKENLTLTLSDTHKRIIHNATVQVMQLGGDAVAGLTTLFGGRNIDAVRDFLLSGANASITSPGAPISFEIKYVHDNFPAQLSNTLEYTYTYTDYHPVAPQNNVEIDVFNIRIDPPTSTSKTGKMKIDQRSYAEIRNLRVTTGINGTEQTINSGNFNRGRYRIHGGADIPIYNVYRLPSMGDTNNRIRISCQLYVYTHVYRDLNLSPDTKGETIEFIAEFGYRDGRWQMLTSEGNTNSPFIAIEKIAHQVGSAAVNARLNYRFEQDRQAYPLR